MTRIAVVGAGIAGLSVAHALLRQGARERGVDVVVLERTSRPGGNIRTDLFDGYLCEWGPNGFLDNAPATLELVDQLGLGDRLHPSDDAARRRFLYRRGRMHELPGTPGGFIRTGVLSAAGKLRVAMEPFARRRPDGDETIHAFAARRIGYEAADVLIDAMVSGVFGGNARTLSLRACFPKMWQMETDHGGLVRAFIARRRAGRIRKADGMGSPLGRLTSFLGGTEELVLALAASLGPALRLSTSVEAISRAGRYRLALGGQDSIDADAVVLAGGSGATADQVASLDAPLAADLRAIPCAPMVVVCLGYREAELSASLDGFGFLVPRGEGPRLLGALWDSSVYPGRAPAGHALVRVMLGGAHDPSAIGLDDDAAVAVACEGLATVMGERATPCFTKVFRHPLGIPQYTAGHLDRLARIDDRLARHPGLVVAGNAYRGVAINNCVAEAGPMAATLLSLVTSAP
ncbi:MAG: protoporphyrinogen oxidase [Vicinamibacterales bacterium]|nr:protoporphyrinogen oxidase [Vicinamibacterales bacterium]